MISFLSNVYLLTFNKILTKDNTITKNIPYLMDVLISLKQLYEIIKQVINKPNKLKKAFICNKVNIIENPNNKYS